MDGAAVGRRGAVPAPDFPFADAAAFVAAPLAAQREALAGLAADRREEWLRLLENDPRAGRRALARSLRLDARRRRAQEDRWRELADFDRCLAAGRPLAGVDEVGRGPLAGPVTAGAVILPAGYHAPGLDDSKRLTPAARARWAERLRDEALAWAVADVEAAAIDRLGIREAVHRAMARALAGLGREPGLILFDGREVPYAMAGARAVVGGDRRSLSVAAASVLAKVHRDSLLAGYDARWPAYGFARHKGYGSAEHCEALLRLGPCPIHRRSFCGRWLSAAPRPAGTGVAR
ncbi:MAG: ribonuclease HII [Candidatus Krumholzibacteriota bacterium]|nr:ribonuclease HII [Candidatus Krumholzibacteriota bacterium]